MNVDDAIASYKEDWQVQLEYHKRPPYVTASFHDMESRRGLVDPGSSPKKIPFSTFEAIGQEYVVEQPIEMSGFGGDASLTFATSKMIQQ